MKTKRIFRLRNTDLYDIDAMRVERLAKKGWKPKTMSRSSITFERGEPRDIKCRLLFYDTAEPSYNRRMTELQAEGWTYVSSDGVSQTMLTTPKDGSAPDITDPKNEERVIKRHRMAQGICAAICFAALAFLVVNALVQYNKLPINRVFIYATIFAYGLQCIACCISHTRNLITVSGEAGPRTSFAPLYFHAALAVLTGVMLVVAIVFALCYN